MLRGGLKSSFSMRAYLEPSASPVAAVSDAAHLAQLAMLRLSPGQEGAFASMLRVAALLQRVDTSGVAPLEMLDEKGQVGREAAPFEPWQGVRPGQLLVLPSVKNNKG
jgi:hypothetical protein